MCVCSYYSRERVISESNSVGGLKVMGPSSQIDYTILMISYNFPRTIDKRTLGSLNVMNSQTLPLSAKMQNYNNNGPLAVCAMYTYWIHGINAACHVIIDHPICVLLPC